MFHQNCSVCNLTIRIEVSAKNLDNTRRCALQIWLRVYPWSVAKHLKQAGLQHVPPSGGGDNGAHLRLRAESCGIRCTHRTHPL
jgi:hypothetical protein